MKGRSGFTLVELLIVVAVIGVIAAIALPALARARMSANEASAIASLRAVNSGQYAFRFTCGGGLFSPTLQNLGLLVHGAPGFISPDLAGPAPVIKSGYRVDMATSAPAPGASCNGGTMAVSYHATADPLDWGGRRYFATNSPAAIFESPSTLVGVIADTGAPPAPARPVQ